MPKTGREDTVVDVVRASKRCWVTDIVLAASSESIDWRLGKVLAPV
jgi:hypothetical protein